MGIFGKMVATAVNLATLPYALGKDVVTLGGTMTGQPSAIGKKLQQIKDEAK